MSLLEIDFPTPHGVFKLHRTHRVADFEDIIRLDFCHPPQQTPRERVQLDSKPTPTTISDLKNVEMHDEAGSFEYSIQSEIVRFR